MTDTPLTDAIVDGKPGERWPAMVELASSLERRLAEAQERIVELETQVSIERQWTSGIKTIMEQAVRRAEAAEAQKPGYVSVPREPTGPMLIAGAMALISNGADPEVVNIDAEDCYKAMLAAAPEDKP